MIYAIIGQTYTGKTTLAHELSKETGLPVVSFSQGPRDIATLVTGMAFTGNWQTLKHSTLHEAWYGGKVNESYTGRDLITDVAESLKDIFGQSIWAKYILLHNQNCIIDDLRFLGEYDVLKHFPHKIIRTVCDDRIERALKVGVELNFSLALTHFSPPDYEINEIIAHETVNTSRYYDVKRLL